MGHGRARRPQGLTLIEVLVSAVIAALLLSSLASFFALAGVKRLQSQRLSEATQLAESQINEVTRFWETFAEDGESYFDKQALVFAWSDEYFPEVPTISNYRSQVLKDPSAIPANAPAIPEALRIIPVDTDGDNQADFLAQVFVGNTPDAEPGELKRLVVRIYDKQAPLEDMDQTPVVALKPLVYGNNEAFTEQGLQAPLVVLVADIRRPEAPL
jgi:prepilin-type N-terminal cleavage/methylation domain-containing protein